MRSIVRKRPMLMATAFVALGTAPAAVSLLHAQEVKCYAEVCVPTANGGETCYQKPIRCPVEQI